MCLYEIALYVLKCHLTVVSAGYVPCHWSGQQAGYHLVLKTSDAQYGIEF